MEVTASRAEPAAAGVTVHRSRILAQTGTSAPTWGSASPLRVATLLDVAPRLTPKRLARTVDDALHTDLLTRCALAEQVRRHPHVPGASRIARLLSTTDGPSRSDWERAFPAFCRRHGLPRPRLNTTIAGYEVDAVWPDARLIVELDGWEFHSSRTAFESDRDRDAETLLAGFATVRDHMGADARRCRCRGGTPERDPRRPSPVAHEGCVILAARRQLLTRAA